MRKIAILLALVINACTTTTHETGAELRQVKLDQVNAGTTKVDVFKLLGSPSTKSLYGKESWYYITDKVKRGIVIGDEVLKNDIIAISFDKDSKVDDMQIYSTDDMRDISVNNTITPTAGKAPSVVDELLGNVGKFNGDSTTSSTTGSRAPGGGRQM